MAKVRLDFESDAILGLEKTFGKIDDSMERLSTESKQLSNDMTNAFEKSTKSAKKLDNELEDVTKQTDKLGKEVKDVGKFSNAFEKQTKRVTELKNEYKNLALAGRENGKVAKNLKKEYQKLEAQLQDVAQKTDGVATKTKTFGSTVTEIGTGFVVGQAISKGLDLVGQAFTHAIDLHREFETSLQNLSAITGAEGPELDFYAESARQLGLKVEGGASAAVEAFKLIGSAQPILLKNKEALVGVTESALLLSEASGLELPEAATRLTDAMNQFGASSDEASKFVDTLANGAKFGSVEIPQITDALLKFGVIAKTSGIDIAESAGLIELLGENGLKGAEAGTALRNVLSKLSAVDTLPKEALDALKQAGVDITVLGDKTVPVADRLKELGKIQNDASALTRVFGLENKTAAQILLTNQDRLSELTNSMYTFGTASEQAEKNTDTLDNALLKLGNQYDDLLLSITEGDFGDLIKGFVNDALNALKGLSNAFKDVGALIKNGFDGTVTAQIETREAEKQADEFVKRLLNGQKELTKKQIEEAEKRGETINAKELNAQQAAQRRTAAIRATAQVKAAQLELKNTENLSNERRKQLEDRITIASLTAKKLIEIDKKTGGVILDGQKEVNDESVKADEKTLEKRKKLREDFAKEVEKLAQQVQKAELDALTGEAKVIREKEIADAQLAELQKGFLERKKAAGLGNKLSAEEEKQFAILRESIEVDAAKKILDIRAKNNEALLRQQVDQTKTQEQQLQQRTDLRVGAVELEKRPRGFSEVKFEAAKQLQIAQIKRQAVVDALELKQDELVKTRNLELAEQQNKLKELEGRTDKEAEILRKNIEDKIQAIKVQFDLDFDKTSQDAAKASQELGKQIEEASKALNAKEPFDIFKFLGIVDEKGDPISDGDKEKVKGAIKQIGDNIFAIYNASIQGQLAQLDAEQAINDERKALREDNLSNLESQLEEELRLQEAGLANNVDAIRAQISAELSAKQQAIEEDKRIAAERERIARQQAVVDTVTQGVNLLTAATNVFKTLSPIPFVGIPLAIGVIASMLGAFAVQRAQVFAAIKQGQGFKDGVIDLQGPGTKTSDSIPANLSKGESVMTADETERHKNLLLGIRNDDRELLKIGIQDLIAGKGIVLESDLPKKLEARKGAIILNQTNNNNNNNSKMEEILSKMDIKLKSIAKSSSEEIITLKDGSILIKKGNKRRIIRRR